MLHVCANRETFIATMFPHQCFLDCRALNVDYLEFINNDFKIHKQVKTNKIKF